MAYGAVIYGSGDGSSEENAINIDSVDAWLWLTTHDSDWSKCFKVSADINFGGIEITKVATTGFTGIFDGNYCTLLNFSIDATAAEYTAMFERIASPSVIKNLTIREATAIGTSSAGSPSYCGILVGESAYGSLISNCDITGAIEHTHTHASYYSCVGMIVGANHGNMENCSTAGTVKGKITAGTLMDIGGVVGLQTGKTSAGTASHLINCQSSVIVSDLDGTSSVVTTVGGICGRIDDLDLPTAPNGNYLDNNEFVGGITYASAAPVNVGGITGLSQGLISKCGAICNITIVQSAGAANTSTIGGCVGNTNQNTSTSFYSGTISLNLNANTYFIGGFVGYVTASDLIVDCYAKGTIWDAKESSSILAFNFGGFSGYLSATSTITNCWTAFTAYSAKGGSGVTVKGFVAFNAGATFTANSDFFDSTISGSTDSYALGKTTTQMQTLSTFSNYAFDDAHWKFNTSAYITLFWVDFFSTDLSNVSWLPKRHYSWGFSNADLATRTSQQWVDYATITHAMSVSGANGFGYASSRALFKARLDICIAACLGANVGPSPIKAKIGFNWSPWHWYYYAATYEQRQISGAAVPIPVPDSTTIYPYYPASPAQYNAQNEITIFAEALSYLHTWLDDSGVELGAFIMDHERLSRYATSYEHTLKSETELTNLTFASDVFTNMIKASFPNAEIVWYGSSVAIWSQHPYPWGKAPGGGQPENQTPPDLLATGGLLSSEMVGNEDMDSLRLNCYWCQYPDEIQTNYDLNLAYGAVRSQPITKLHAWVSLASGAEFTTPADPHYYFWPWSDDFDYGVDYARQIGKKLAVTNPNRPFGKVTTVLFFLAPYAVDSNHLVKTPHFEEYFNAYIAGAAETTAIKYLIGRKV